MAAQRDDVVMIDHADIRMLCPAHEVSVRHLPARDEQAHAAEREHARVRERRDAAPQLLPERVASQRDQ